MIRALALLLAQAVPSTPPPAAAPAPLPAARPSPPLRPLNAAAAVDAFKTLCWAHLRMPDDLRAAIPAATIALVPVPGTRAGATQTWRADAAVLNYSAADDLPSGVPTRQCGLHTRLAGPADQLALAGRIAEALDLHGGATRAGPTGARTLWDVAQPDGRVVRLIVSTANAPCGQTDLWQLALLLSPK